MEIVVSEKTVWRNRLQQRFGSGNQPKCSLDIVVFQKLAGDADDEAVCLKALESQRQGADQRLVQMVARGLEVGDEPGPFCSQQMKLGE